MLKIKIDSLPRTLEFTGEYGAEINSFMPFVYWLTQAGYMTGRTIITYKHMKPYYFFLTEEQYQEKAATRSYVPPNSRPEWLPNKNDHYSVRKPDEWFPDYRHAYKDGISFPKPILVIHNKYTSEWGERPINYFSTAILRTIFEKYHTQFQIIYFPANITRSASYGLVTDHQESLELDEQSVLAGYPDVITIDDLLDKAEGKETFNSLKLKIFASCHRFLIVQGGNVHLASLFPGSVVVVLHRRGSEIEHSYAAGHFRYASNPRPTLLICRNEDDFLAGADAIQNLRVIAEQAWLAPAGLDLLDRFGPHRLKTPLMNAKRSEEGHQSQLATDLKGRTFAFGRVDGSRICDVTLNSDGSLSGPRSPNERSWAVQDGKLIFRSESGDITTVFDQLELDGAFYKLIGRC